MPGTTTEPLYKFYNANIHERRWIASFVRWLPFISIVVIFLVIERLSHLEKTAFLVICAFFNTSMWIWIMSNALLGLQGVYKTSTELANELNNKGIVDKISMLNNQDEEETGTAGTGVQPLHVVILPNYKEDEELLGSTLRCLSEASGSQHFWVVLAMEEREPEAEKKARRLRDLYDVCFARILVTMHPAGLLQEHLDGSAHDEVPGKASNNKWAVKEVYDTLAKEGDAHRIPWTVLTIADADCLMHPSYFAKVGYEFSVLSNQPGNIQHWFMWQAPQLPFRNYYAAPAPSRVWGYISSTYEFGGVSSLSTGGHHMVFSAYSVSLELAVMRCGMTKLAEGAASSTPQQPGEVVDVLWDGDVIAEDHHAFLKAWYYSTWYSAAISELAQSDMGCRPSLRVRPVMLPVKSTSVMSDDYWQTWSDRWGQAVRHCQGVAELSYSLLAFWDMIGTLPWRAYNCRFILQTWRVLIRMWFMHLFPLFQFMALTKLTSYWLFHGKHLPQCPDRVWVVSHEKFLLCGLAGAWALTWPVLIPFVGVAASNFYFLKVVFLRPKEQAEERVKENKDSHVKAWYAADGGIPPTFGSQTFTVMWRITIDFLFLVSPLMVVYGVLAMVVGCWNVFRRGNSFNYVSASKALSAEGSGVTYGSITPNEAPNKPKDRQNSADVSAEPPSSRQQSEVEQGFASLAAC